MKPNRIQIAPNFSLWEFQDRATSFVALDPRLPEACQAVRDAINSKCKYGAVNWWWWHDPPANLIGVVNTSGARVAHTIDSLRNPSSIPLSINSACRTWPEQARIYQERCSTHAAACDSICLTSCHLIGPISPEEFNITLGSIGRRIITQRLGGEHEFLHWLHIVRTCSAVDLQRPPKIDEEPFVAIVERIFGHDKGGFVYRMSETAVHCQLPDMEED